MKLRRKKETVVPKEFSIPEFVSHRELQRINVSLGKKFNLGNYESLDLHVSLSRDIEPNEFREDAFNDVFECVRSELVRQAQKVGIKVTGPCGNGIMLNPGDD